MAGGGSGPQKDFLGVSRGVCAADGSRKDPHGSLTKHLLELWGWEMIFVCGRSAQRVSWVLWSWGGRNRTEGNVARRFLFLQL